MAGKAHFEVYPQFDGDDTTHPTDVHDETEYLPGGEITVARGHCGTCGTCDWTEKGDPADTRDAAAAHEREHPKATGQYGWRLRSANGQIVAVAGESFTRPEDAERACTDAAEAMAQIEWAGPEGSAVCVEPVES